MNDVKISKISNIPYQTIQLWKKDEGTWKQKFYMFLKNLDEDEVGNIFINNINNSNYKGLQDSVISEIVGIPYRTLVDWKKDNSTYRSKIYHFFKKSDESKLRIIFT